MGPTMPEWVEVAAAHRRRRCNGKRLATVQGRGKKRIRENRRRMSSSSSSSSVTKKSSKRRDSSLLGCTGVGAVDTWCKQHVDGEGLLVVVLLREAIHDRVQERGSFKHKEVHGNWHIDFLCVHRKHNSPTPRQTEEE